MIRCPNCGEQNDPGSRFCFNCGANLAATEPTPDRPLAPEPPPEPESQPAFPPPLPPPDRDSIPPQYQPPSYPSGQHQQPGQPGGWGPPPAHPSGWAAIDQLDPPPPPRRRATWLMVLLGIVAGCLLVCVGTFIYFLTPSGQDTFEELGTVVAEFATETAPEPTQAP